MSHYFLTPDSDEKRRLISVQMWGRDYTLTTANGVFSGTRLDPGTAVLFRETTPPTRPGRYADIGCGVGPIAIALAAESPLARVDAVDVNDRALKLTDLNAHAAGVGDRVRTLRPEQVEGDARYDELWSNPPIRIGKPALHALLLDWLPRIAPAGRMVLVVGKNLGADSLQRWITEQSIAGHGFDCQRLASAKGFRVLEVRPANLDSTGASLES